MGKLYIHVYIPSEDKELQDWIARLKRDHVVITAVVRDVLRAHVRGEKRLTEEGIAAAVVWRLREEGLVLSGDGDHPVEDETDFIAATLAGAAKEFA